MSDDLIFDARVTKARKQHRCLACLRPIMAGETYIEYPGKDSKGEFSTRRLCIECSFLLTQKTGADASSVREGEFSDRLIPNFLRKKRAEFRRNPKAAITAAGLANPAPAAAETPARPVQQIIVKAAEFDRRIFHLPESRFKAAQFPKGGTLTIKAGVTGKSRTARIIMARSTTGEAFGCNKRQVAILVA
jgi:hypothetical protein